MEPETSSLIDNLVHTLDQLPGARANVAGIEPASGGTRLDYLVEAEIDGTPVALAVEIKRSVFPRDVREVIWQIERYLGTARSPGRQLIGMLAADTLSPGARDALVEARVGYFDGDGSLYLPAKGAFVLIDRPPGKRAQRVMGSVFKGQRAQVLHVLVAHPETWFSVKDLAFQAEVSPATTSQTLVDLERRDWVEVRGGGPSKERRLSRPGQLLDAWAEEAAAWALPSALRFYVPGSDVIERFARSCEMLQVPYAFTGLAAAQLYAPFLTAVPQATCWASPPLLGAALTDVGARETSEGWNLAILRAEPDAAIFKHAGVHDGVRWVSPLQAFLDLQHAGGRAREMAAHLREEYLKI